MKLSVPRGNVAGMIGKLHAIAFDCPDPKALADFYSELLGLPVTYVDDDWVSIGEHAPKIGFQLAPDHVAPRWPDPAFPQQAHLDVEVERADLEDAERRVLALGATRLPGDGENWRVYADPVGHPFCLVWH